MHIDTFCVINHANVGQISACTYTKHQSRPRGLLYVIRIFSYVSKVGGVRGESGSLWIA